MNHNRYLKEMKEGGVCVDQSQKLKEIIRCFDMWLSARDNNCFIGSYLQKLNVKAVGIYGYGRLGKHLLNELEDSSVEVRWIMDQRDISGQIDYCCLGSNDEKIPLDIDMIINTAIGSSGEIEKKFLNMGFHRVVSLMEVLEEVRHQNIS